MRGRPWSIPYDGLHAATAAAKGHLDGAAPRPDPRSRWSASVVVLAGSRSERLRRPPRRSPTSPIHERLEQFGELHGEHELRGGTRSEGFQGLQILEAHRIRVHGLGDL